MLDFSKIAGKINRDVAKPNDLLNQQQQEVNVDNQQSNQQSNQQVDNSGGKSGVEILKPTSVGENLPQYFRNINMGLNKLSGFKGTFSPEQRRKIANVYSKARTKYNLSSKTSEDTTAFNELKSNPIWKSFNNN